MLQSKFWQCVQRTLSQVKRNTMLLAIRNLYILVMMSANLYEAVESYCRELLRSPRVVEFRSIRKVMSDKAGSLHIEVPPLTYNTLIRKVSADFKGQLNFTQQSANNTLVYPCTLTIEDLVVDNYNLKSEQESMKEFVDDEAKVTIKVAKTLNKLVNDHPPLMSWLSKESDILPNKVSQYITKLLDVLVTHFCPASHLQVKFQR